MSPEIPDAVRQLLIQFAETGSIEDDLQQLAQSLPDARHHQIAFCELLAMASEWADDPLNWLLSGIQQGRWLVSPEQQMHVLQALYRDWSNPVGPLTWTQLSSFGFSPWQLDLRQPDEFWPLGQILHGYQLETRLAAGSFAVVYRGKSLENNASVAIRVPRKVPIETMQAERSERLSHEAKLLQNLHLPGVPRLLASYQTEHGPIVITELIIGSPWSDLSTDQLPLSQHIALLARVAEIADRVHQSGLIHGDLKRENVLVDEQNCPWLLDFNVSRLAEPDQPQLQSLAGTLAIMSPEALLTSDDGLDFRRDIYSLGAVLYELVTGLPWTTAGSREEALVETVVKGAAEGPQFPGHVPEGLQQIIRAAVSHEEFRRFETAADFAACCHQWLANPSNPLPCPPVNAPLTCWRLGLALGLFASRCQGLLRIMKSLPEIPAEAKAPTEILNRMDHVMGLPLAATEIRTLASLLGHTVPELPDEKTLAAMFYRARRLTGASLPELLKLLDGAQEWFRIVFDQLRSGLSPEQSLPWSVLELGIQTRLAPESSSARRTWSILADGIIPEMAAAAFAETCRNPPDRSGWKSAIDALNYDVVRYFRWAATENTATHQTKTHDLAATD